MTSLRELNLFSCFLTSKGVRDILKALCAATHLRCLKKVNLSGCHPKIYDDVEEWAQVMWEVMPHTRRATLELGADQ
jgi:hypothetical protein